MRRLAALGRSPRHQDGTALADGSLRQSALRRRFSRWRPSSSTTTVQRKLSMAWTGGKSSTELHRPGVHRKRSGLRPVLAKLNSSEAYKDYPQSHLAMEVFTHLSTSPDVSVLGVNRKQATELLRHFYDAVYDRYGREGVERFVKINEEAQGPR